MRLKAFPKIKVRNHVALSPLLHKGGIHDDDHPKKIHRRDRRTTKAVLQKTDWLNDVDETFF